MRLLEKRGWALGLVALLALLLPLPSLRADLYTDDMGMVLAMEGVAPPVIPGAFHLYTFMSGAAGERDALVRQSAIPWWSVDGIRISFLRPLSSALLGVDHALAGRNPLFYHVHSLLWYLAASLAAAMLFRRLLPAREAGLAAVLFAICPAHFMLGAWPSARHVAISGTFAILALVFHIDARSGQGGRFRALLAVLCAVLALAAGETGLGLFGYIAAYELFERREVLALRLRALAPWAALFFGYALLYKAYAFGVRGVGAYIDPIGQPAAYLSALPTRLVVYLGAALLCIPSEVTLIAPHSAAVLGALGLGSAALLAALLRRSPPTLSAALGSLLWLTVGALLALLPGIASITGDRILFLPDLAVAAGLAVALLHAGKGQPSKALWAARAGVSLFVLARFVLGPAAFVFQSAQLAQTSHDAIRIASSAEIPVRPGLSVIGIGLADPLVGMYLPASLYIAPRPEPRPSAVQVLSMASHDHRVRRIDDRTLELDVIGGTLLDDPLAYLFRGPSSPLHVGETTPLGTWKVRVLEVDAGRPTRFELELDRSVDDPSFAFVVWRGNALRAFTPPKVGDSVLVRHEPGPLGI